MIIITREARLFLAYTASYELFNRSYITDSEWDRLAIELAPTLSPVIPQYTPSTGTWIHDTDWRIYNSALRTILLHMDQI